MTTQLQRFTRNRIFTPGVTVSYSLVLLDDGIVIDQCDIGAASTIDYGTGVIVSYSVEECSMDDFEF